LGRAGEAAAARALERAGLRVLERRWRTQLGEIDLVAEQGELVVFVEVKTRTCSPYGTPAEAVTARKRSRLGRVALAYLAHRGWLERPSRFDVVEVDAGPDGLGRVEHLPDAFRL
ncbi:MAG TPA: YraN family protein, partial [Candidatus Polarisedimenticolaceae bacterium]|nr:YraN family protein [Candidatus Polarisedimenticolaceae bacterium]